MHHEEIVCRFRGGDYARIPMLTGPESRPLVPPLAG